MLLLLIMSIIQPLLCGPTIQEDKSQWSRPQSSDQFDLWINEQITFVIKEIKETDEGRSFLMTHDEETLRISIAFLQNPEKYFSSFRYIPNPCEYFWAYQMFRFSKREIDQDLVLYDFFDCLGKYFDTIDPVRVSMLSHLILVCNAAIFEEALADRYSKQFEKSPKIFISDLKKRRDWRKIIEHLLSGDWRAFKAGVSSLGSSPFERELQAYVASLEK